MKYRKLTKDWDYSFGHGQDDYITDVDAVYQAIQTRLKLLTNEWWEDLEDGLPLFQVFVGKSNTPVNKQSMDLVAQQRIEQTAGVTGISDFESDVINRKYTINATVHTIYGDIPNMEVSL